MHCLSAALQTRLKFWMVQVAPFAIMLLVARASISFSTGAAKAVPVAARIVVKRAVSFMVSWVDLVLLI